MKAIPHPPCDWAGKMAEIERARKAREQRERQSDLRECPCGAVYVRTHEWYCPSCGEV